MFIIVLQLGIINTINKISLEMPGESKDGIIYTLTEKGKDLIPVLVEIIVWSSKYKDGLNVSPEFLAKLDKSREEIIHKVRTSIGTKTFSGNQGKQKSS